MLKIINVTNIYAVYIFLLKWKLYALLNFGNHWFNYPLNV